MTAWIPDHVRDDANPSFPPGFVIPAHAGIHPPTSFPAATGNPGLRSSALFACVPNPQDVHREVNQFIAHFVVADDDATHFARQVLIQLSATLGAIKQTPWCQCQGLYCACCGGWVYFGQKVIEPRNIGNGFVGPL